MTTRNEAKVKKQIVWKWNITGIDDAEVFFNRKIAEGWKPVRVGMDCSRFVFEPCEPGEYICRTTSTINKYGFFDKKKSREIKQILMDSGAELVEHSWFLRDWIGVCAVRKASLGNFEINSDLDSRTADYEARTKNAIFKCVTLFMVFAAVWAFEWTRLGRIYQLDVIVLAIIMTCVYGLLIYKQKKKLRRYKEQRGVSEL